MTLKEYQELRQKIQARSDADVAALDRVYALVSGSQAPAIPAEVEPGPVPAKRHYAQRGKKLSAEEKKERQRAYQRAWWKKNRAKPARNGHENGDVNALSQAKFNKFLVKGPAAGGGNG